MQALLIFILSVDFYVCMDTDGVRHFSNVQNIYNEDCSIKDDVHLQLYRNQYQDMYTNLKTKKTTPKRDIVDFSKHVEDIKSEIMDTLDSDKALDELYKNQQQKRTDVPFKTPLQTEGFDRLLELQ